MGKRTRGKKANATRPRRHRGALRDRGQAPVAAVPEREPDPLHQIAETLDEDHPLSLLMLASSLLASLDPPVRSPFDPEPTEDLPTIEDLVTSFLEIDRPETTALVAVIATLVDDDVLRRRIDRELPSLPQTLPAWVGALRTASAGPTHEMVHVLGDSDNVIVGLHVPPGHDLTVMALVDHNIGTAVADAMVVPDSTVAFVEQARAVADDPDTTMHTLDPADARARLEDAIRTGSMMYPPLESDSWPAARPLLEWVLRQLPTGGSNYPRPEWDDHALAELTERFFASSFGAALDDTAHRGLLESLLWFGTDYGPGDPLRWSPQVVEIVLGDWIPRKIVAGAEYLGKAPGLLRAWIRFCHAERGVREALTGQTLEAVDRLEDEYHATIRSPRPQGPEALLAAMGAPDDGVIGPDVLEEVMLRTLRASVGGPDALDDLSTEPLPDEPFDWATVPDDLHGRIGEALELVDRCCDDVLDVEYRTACRRVLARIVSGDPERARRGRADTLAAATCWIVGKANDLFHGSMTARDLAARFGLGSGSVSQRGKTLLPALGVESDGYHINLGTPDLLTSARRARIAADRDSFRETAAALR